MGKPAILIAARNRKVVCPFCLGRIKPGARVKAVSTETSETNQGHVIDSFHVACWTALKTAMAALAGGVR